MRYNLNDLPDLEELKDLKSFLKDVFLEPHKGKYPKISHICGTCFHLFNLGDTNGICGEKDVEVTFDSSTCKKWVENDETVEWQYYSACSDHIQKSANARDISPKTIQKHRGENGIVCFVKKECVNLKAIVIRYNIKIRNVQRD